MAKLEANDPWLALLLVLSEADIESTGPEDLLRMQRVWIRIDQMLTNQPKMKPTQREMLEIYREALRVVGTIGQLQVEHALESVNFMLRSAPALQVVADSAGIDDPARITP